MRHQPGRLGALIAALAIAAASGCGGDPDSSDDLPSDAIARVDQTVITNQQLRASLAKMDPQVASRRRLAARRLIGLEWVKQEAARQDVDVPGSRAQSFLLFVDLVRRAGGPPPTEQQIVRHYRSHPQWYGAPETRYMKLVATDSRDQASAAKQALEQGKNWKAVIARYSTDKTVSPASGTMGSGPREMPPHLGSALYAARRGTFYGPVKTADAWYAFELTHVFEQPGQTLEQSRELVVAELERVRGARGLKALRRRLIATYRPKTVCDRRLRLPECRNGPPIKPTDLSSLGGL